MNFFPKKLLIYSATLIILLFLNSCTSYYERRVQDFYRKKGDELRLQEAIAAHDLQELILYIKQIKVKSVDNRISVKETTESLKVGPLIGGGLLYETTKITRTSYIYLDRKEHDEIVSLLKKGNMWTADSDYGKNLKIVNDREGGNLYYFTFDSLPRLLVTRGFYNCVFINNKQICDDDISNTFNKTIDVISGCLQK
ncbi:MAG: hypothetical protein Q8M54_01770 [Desulfobaccales bacterium]|nr:hypothetical protein [Desulfobaccales bacterium]